jgi:hypothetical protein
LIEAIAYNNQYSNNDIVSNENKKLIYEKTVANVNFIKDKTDMKLLLENMPYVPEEGIVEEISEPQLISRIVYDTDTNFLFDTAHARVSAYYKDMNLSQYMDKLPMDDRKVFKLISDGKTAGVFQLESAGMTQFMKELQPSSLEDIIAGNSLYRPGPMDQIPRYIRNKNNPSELKYDHPLLENILNVNDALFDDVGKVR